MKNGKKILICKTVFYCMLCMLFLSGCARRERQTDGLDELSLTDEAPVQSGQPGGEPQGQTGSSGDVGYGREDADAQEPAPVQGGGAQASAAAQGAGSAAIAGAAEQGNMTDVSECADCYVYICGAVKEPGVYRMSQNDRIYAVIERAGGFSETACEDYVNQALKVADGLKIWIPTIEEAKKAASGEALPVADSGGLTYPPLPEENSTDGQSGSGLVNINTAGEEQLCTLTGIGKAKAQAIIAYRMEHGNFARPEDIMNVTGIKQSGFEKIKDGICVN